MRYEFHVIPFEKMLSMAKKLHRKYTKQGTIEFYNPSGIKCCKITMF